MRRTIFVFLLAVGASVAAQAQTAEDLVSKNLQARGGVEKMKALNSLRMSGTASQGDFKAQIMQEQKRPDLLRESFSIQGMTAVTAYNGKSAWTLQPFGGRRDPEMMGEDDARDLIESADFDGPLVDYQQKGNTIEYLGHDTVDGDDAYRLKVTLKNGDVLYYYLDPDTYIEIRVEKQQFIRGAMRETQTDLGSYKPVNGVMFPYSIESGPKNSSFRQKISLEKIEANVPVPDSDFQMPAARADTGKQQQHAEPPTPELPKGKKQNTAPAKPPASAKPPVL